MYSVDEITCTFTISGLAGRFEEWFTFYVLWVVSRGASFHLALLLLVLAVLLVTGEVATSGEALSHKWLPTCDLRTNLPRKGHLQVILDKVLGPELDITCFLDLMAEGRSLLG